MLTPHYVVVVPNVGKFCVLVYLGQLGLTEFMVAQTINTALRGGGTECVKILCGHQGKQCQSDVTEKMT
jgi:hypothetical protein